MYMWQDRYLTQKTKDSDSNKADLYMEALMDIANNKISVEEVKDMVDIHRE